MPTYKFSLGVQGDPGSADDILSRLNEMDPSVLSGVHFVFEPMFGNRLEFVLTSSCFRRATELAIQEAAKVGFEVGDLRNRKGDKTRAVSDEEFTPTEADFEEAKRLIAEGYHQTSHKYRSLARLPKGKTALEALEEVSPSTAQRLRTRMEEWARSEVLRLNEAEKITANPRVFNAFKQLKGPHA